MIIYLNFREHEPIKGAVGISIIYGLILCLTGMFVSFDSFAGNLGEYRLISMVCAKNAQLKAQIY